MVKKTWSPINHDPRNPPQHLGGKRAFRQLNINYTVARGGNAGPALGTAAPSSLADVLRQKRSQQVQSWGDYRWL